MTLLTQTNHVQAQKLELTDLNHGNGFTPLELGQKRLIAGYDNILHIFNVTKYEIFISEIEREVSILEDLYLEQQISHLRTKLGSLVPHNRAKRGLINILGTGLKYLSGAMDNEDRIEIEKHLREMETNAHNAITQSNNQIHINDQFDRELENLTLIYNTEIREMIKQYSELKVTSVQQQREIKIEQIKFQLIHLETIIDNVSEMMLTSSLGLLSKNILSDDEIRENNITFEKLQNIKMTVTTTGKTIIFIIRIPIMSMEIYNKLFIQPIPNKQGMELYLETKEYLVNNNIVYSNVNETNKLFKITDNCIENIFKQTTMHCSYKQNNRKTVVEIYTNILFAINMINENVTQTCNEIPIILNGSYMIKIENCKIKILDKWYDKNVHQENVVLPNPLRMINVTEEKDISLHELRFHHIKNLKHIDELKIKQRTTNIAICILIMIIVVIVIVHVFVKLRPKKTINKTIISLPHLPSEYGQRSSSGGVMEKPTPIHKLPFDP